MLFYRVVSDFFSIQTWAVYYIFIIILTVFRESSIKWAGNVTSPNHQRAQGPIWINNMHCSGKETHLDQCRHSDLRVHNCTHDNDVYLSCGKGKRILKNESTDLLVSKFIVDKTSGLPGKLSGGPFSRES